MAFTRSCLITTPHLNVDNPSELESVYWEPGSTWQDRPFKLQVGRTHVMLTYQELSKLMADADGEIRDYLGDEHV